MPGPEPMNRATATTGTSAMSTDNTTAPAPTPQPMTAEEQEAVQQLQWLNNADAVRDASNELAQAKAESRNPVVLVFARRGLSYPGLSREQLSEIRRKVNDKIVEGSSDMIFGPTHRELRQKLRTYAIAYNQTIAAAL